MGDAPRHLRTLIERFDPDVFDAPQGSARIRLRVNDKGDWDVLTSGDTARLKPADEAVEPDALLSADEQTWQRIGKDIRGGMDAYGRGRLRVRHNLHLGVGLLAATSGMTEPGRLEFHRARTRQGDISYLQAGRGKPVVLIHGLGGTKASFLPTVAALADRFRLVALDLPGFGDSDKPIGAPYDAAYFAKAVASCLDELRIERAHVIGNSMGGRVALELGFAYPDRTAKLALLAPSLAWLRERRWAGVPPSMRRRARSTWRSPTARTASGPGWARSRRSPSSSGASATGWCRSPSRVTSRRRFRPRSTWRSTAATCRRWSVPPRLTERCGAS